MRRPTCLAPSSTRRKPERSWLPVPHALSAAFTPADPVLYTTATASTVLVVNPVPRTTPAISWPTPASIAQGTPLGAAQLNATAAVAGSFVYSPAAGTVLPVGTHTLSAVFTPSDASRYETATAYMSLTVTAPVLYRLTVFRPTGGNVSAAGINCGTAGTACVVTMPASTSIGARATADAGYTFTAWSGDCAGTLPSINISITGSVTCGATFTATTTGGSTNPPPTDPPSTDSNPPLGAPYTVTVVRPTGGRVTAVGVNCGTRAKSCAVTMPGPMAFALQARPDSR